MMTDLGDRDRTSGVSSWKLLGAVAGRGAGEQAVVGPGMGCCHIVMTAIIIFQMVNF